MKNTVIFNACIITMNESMEVIKNGSIRIEEDCIKEIQNGRIEIPGRGIF